MKNKLVTRTSSLLLAVTAVFGATPRTEAGDVGHYDGGTYNIRDFFVPDPGVYAAVYSYFYTTDRFNDQSGNQINSITINRGPGGGTTVNLKINLDMYAVAPALIWVTPWKFLDAKYAAMIVPAFANASIEGALSTARDRGGSVGGSAMGAGDLFVQPVWLGWTLDHWDFTAAYGFYAPVGKYSTQTFSLGGNTATIESPDNIGLGFWTHQFQGGAAWYPWTNRATAVTAVLTYEYNGRKQDLDVRPGQILTLNWGVSQYLPLTKDEKLLLEIGPAGYDSWQITDSYGSRVIDPSSRTTVHAAGGQLGLTYVPWMLAVNFHAFYEYAAQGRLQGEAFGISITKKF